MKAFNCRVCNSEVTETFADLGKSPLANALLQKGAESSNEKFYPLRAYVCNSCLLVQLDVFASREVIFEEYSYFSSFSNSWLETSKKYATSVTERFHYNENSLVVEIGSNDGYLLRYFKERGIPVLGIEPAANVAKTAIELGVPTKTLFFGEQTANKLVKEGYKADHIVIKNVLAHVPDLHDFIRGMKSLLKAGGTISIEFPHLLKLMQQNQFDTIYHEHFSYFSLATAEKAFAMNQFSLFDVEELPTHGGSLRIWIKHEEDPRPVNIRLNQIRAIEKANGLLELSTYRSFQKNVEQTKLNLLRFLRSERALGKRIAAYGAPAKGNTLLNYCGISTDLIEFTVDRNPYKQGCLLPGTHIPVFSPEKIMESRPDYLLILPWNLKEEVVKETAFISKWGGRHVVPIPTVEVLNPTQNEILSNAA